MAVPPSLKGLQAFEAAARTGSFAAAAEELSVSAAAVSQLIRTVEEQMGRKLFHRVNRRVVLTEAGVEMLPRLTMAFQEIGSVARQLDIRLSYGPHYREHPTEDIVQDAVYPVCAPGLADTIKPEGLASLPLIHTGWGPTGASFPSWHNWFEAAGIEPAGQRSAASRPTHRAQRSTLRFRDWAWRWRKESTVPRRWKTAGLSGPSPRHWSCASPIA